jgi:NADPH:quinone reductase-like Zn-dependent oxidoreductase
MLGIRLEGHGQVRAFQACELPRPEPGPGEIRIRAEAIGVNFADILARQGIYPGCPPLPCLLGYEVAGVVEALGSGVDAHWAGRRVMALTNFGAYAQAVCVDVRYAWEIPESLSAQEAAAVPLNSLTAWGLLQGMGSLAAHETVLIHNAGGGVGLAALDIAKHTGARIIATASAGKHARLRERGADCTVDYRARDWTQDVLELTGGRGVDLVLDPIGGAHWKLSRSVLAPAGRLGMYGISSASAPGLSGKLNLLGAFLRAPWFHPARLIPGNQGAYGINIHAMYEQANLFSVWMARIQEGLQKGWMRPHVDRVFPLREVGAAHAWIEGRQNFGKVVLIPDAP